MLAFMRVLQKSDADIALMAEGGRILARIMRDVADNARPGMMLAALDRLAHRLMIDAGGDPAFLGYRPDGALRPYPASICASVNEVVVHGVPSKYVLQEGDLLKLDFGLRFKGFCTDAALTVPIGKISSVARRLLETTQKALEAGIEAARPGNHLGDIGFAVNLIVSHSGFRVVKGLTGHGIGRALHEEPVVLNYGRMGDGILLKKGMVLAIEPMTSIGSDIIVQREDEGYATKDGSLSAHFEHTVAITEQGPKILTVL